MVRRSVALKNREIGFTLIEVTFAVLILASSLVTLLGLQSSVLQQAVRDKNKERALLIGRRILSVFESSSDMIEPREVQGDISKIVNDFALPDGDEVTKLQQLNYTGKLSISEWGIPNLDPRAMKRIALTISWGASSLDSLELVYFVPVGPDPTDE